MNKRINKIVLLLYIMETTRQQKISRLIQKELATIFQRDAKSFYHGALITVTKVHVAKDLAVAKVFLSLFVPTSKEDLMKTIRHRTREIRLHLGEKVKTQLRVIPELEFFIDDSLDYIENLEKLLKP
jgi:ribosome-binding factor A